MQWLEFHFLMWIIGVAEFEPRSLHITCNIPTNWVMLTVTTKMFLFSSLSYFLPFCILAINWKLDDSYYAFINWTVNNLSCRFHINLDFQL
jgi:hypothetical protein